MSTARGEAKRGEKSWREVLRARRLSLGKSQDDVVRDSSGLLYQTEVSRLERGLVHPTKDLGLEKFCGLLKALEWTVESFAAESGLELPFASPEEVAAVEAAIEAVRRLEVYDDWLAFPVYGSVSAGDKAAKPLEDEVSFVPQKKLRAKGADPDFVRIYLVNGDCMISDEARRLEKNIAPGDYVAVDIRSRPQAGDVVVAWWPDEEKLVVKRYRVEKESIVLYPANPSHPNLVLRAEDDVFIIGRVIWRGG